MSFKLPELSYSYDALEPHIDAQTMRLHHDKHHDTYVNSLNKAIEGGAFAEWQIEDLVRDWAKLPDELRTAVRNHGGGHYNHSLFWKSLSPDGGGEPKGALASAIERELGGFWAMKERLTKEGLGRFGSGWAWLSLDAGKRLLVESTPNQDNPLSENRFPLLGIDVWEHAYYLKYQNRRAEYLDAIFKVIDWTAVGSRYERAMG